MDQEQKEARIQEIRVILMDDDQVHGERRQALLDELHELEKV